MHKQRIVIRSTDRIGGGRGSSGRHLSETIVEKSTHPDWTGLGHVVWTGWCLFECLSRCVNVCTVTSETLLPI